MRFVLRRAMEITNEKIGNQQPARAVALFWLLGVLITLTGPLRSSRAQSGQEPHSAGSVGMSTGGTHAAVLDAQHRPITAGGTVQTGPVIFQDVGCPCRTREVDAPHGLDQ